MEEKSILGMEEAPGLSEELKMEGTVMVPNREEGLGDETNRTLLEAIEAEFAWGKPSTEADDTEGGSDGSDGSGMKASGIKGVNLVVKEGDLICVVGKV